MMSVTAGRSTGLDARNRSKSPFNGIGATGVIEGSGDGLHGEHAAGTERDGSDGASGGAQPERPERAGNLVRELDSGPLYLSALQIWGYAIQGATETTSSKSK